MFNRTNLTHSQTLCSPVEHIIQEYKDVDDKVEKYKGGFGTKL